MSLDGKGENTSPEPTNRNLNHALKTDGFDRESRVGLSVTLADTDVALGTIAENMDLRLLSVLDDLGLDGSTVDEGLTDQSLFAIDEEDLVEDDLGSDFTIQLFSVDGLADFSFYLLSTSENDSVHLLPPLKCDDSLLRYLSD